MFKRFLKPTVRILNLHGSVNQFAVDKILSKLVVKPNQNIKAFALSINSYNGSILEAQRLARQMTAIHSKYKIPIYTFAREYTIEAATIVLNAGSHSFCEQISTVGGLSCSVLKWDVTAMMRHLEIRREVISSLDYPKSQISSQSFRIDHKLSEQQINFLKQRAILLTNLLKDTVQKQRGTKLLNKQVLNGQIILGKQAVQVGLVDSLGSMMEVLAKQYPQCIYDIEPEIGLSWNPFYRL